MNFLFDTNIIIPLESTKTNNETTRAHVLVRLLENPQININKCIHAASYDDILKNKNEFIKSHMARQLEKYHVIPKNQHWYDYSVKNIHRKPKTSNDQADLHLLAALFHGASDYIVTNDRKGFMKSASIDLNVNDKILCLEEAIELVENLLSKNIPPPINVNSLIISQIDTHDPIFESLRKSYKDFDRWLKKCISEERLCWTIDGDSQLAAICIIKLEANNTLKICTFKVSEKYQGNKYGELLLTAIFDYAYINLCKIIYIETNQDQKELLLLLNDFGFSNTSNTNSSTQDYIYSKKIILNDSINNGNKDPLDFNKTYGPRSIMWSDKPIYIIPIKQSYFTGLFPNQTEQKPLFDSSYGNCMKNVYLSNSNIKGIEKGSLILFYISKPVQKVKQLCIVEDFKNNFKNEDEIINYTHRRTIYDIERIRELYSKKTFIVILFRNVRSLDNGGIDLDTLIENDIIISAPQTITKISDRDKIKWIQNRLIKKVY